MNETQIKELMAELEQTLGEGASRDDVMKTIEKVLRHSRSKEADEIVAENEGLPVPAVTISRAIIRNLALAEAESEKKSRLGVHNSRLRLPTIPIPKEINPEGKTYTPSYWERYRKRVPSKEKHNET